MRVYITAADSFPILILVSCDAETLLSTLFFLCCGLLIYSILDRYPGDRLTRRPLEKRRYVLVILLGERS